MSKKTDPAWEHCTPLIEGNTSKLMCNYCAKVYNGGVSRMKHHWGKTNKDAIPCLSCPDDVYLKFKNMLAAKTLAKISERQQQDAPSFMEDGQDCQVVGGKRPLNLVDHGVSKKQNTLNAVWKKTDREKCCIRICRFIYACALPFNVVNHYTFKEMIDEVSQFGLGLKPPSFHEVRNTFLKKEVDLMTVKVDKYKKEWSKFGCTIMSDGWTDGRGRSITNFLVNSPSGSVFLRSLDTSNIIHDADHVLKMLEDIVDEVGEENVIQVVTDCAPAYVKAGKLLQEKRKHLFWSPCAAHVIDLMLKDIGNLTLPLETVTKAKMITVYIYNHPWVLSLMREHTNNKELARPGITRFATNYLTLQSILENRQPLRSMFTSQAWEESSYSKKPDAIVVRDIILGDKNFWPGVKYSINVAGPLVRVLRLVDSDDRPSIGYIYEAMDQAKEKIALNLGGVAGRYMKIWNIIDDRWNKQLHTALHAAAYYLNPRFRFEENFKADEEIVNGYYDVVERMVPSRQERRIIDSQLDKFKMSMGSFGRESAIDGRTSKQPALWWESFGSHCPELQNLAVKILSLVGSATGCERNWSTFEQIHTKKRNRLEQKRLNALVFVKYNLALGHRQANREQGTDPISLGELDEDNEWIVEVEDPVLPQDTTWLDIVDCFAEQEPEPNRKRRGPRNLNNSTRGMNITIEDDIASDDDHMDEDEVRLLDAIFGTHEDD